MSATGKQDNALAAAGTGAVADRPPHPNLTGPRSSEARERSNQNLRRGNAKHGAYSAARREPLERLHRERLAREFPVAAAAVGGQDLINAASRRVAMLDLLCAFVQDAGPIYPHKGLAHVSPAAREARVLIDGHEKAIERLMALEAAHAGRSGDTLASIAAELAGEPDDKDGDSE